MDQEGATGRGIDLAARPMTALQGLWKNPSDHRSFIWIIDAADKLVHVNDAWLAFAGENTAPQLTAASVLNQPIWRFIQGQETIYLYKQIFGRVRAGKSPVKFPFRCDSPDCRRFMEMQLSLLPGRCHPVHCAHTPGGMASTP